MHCYGGNDFMATHKMEKRSIHSCGNSIVYLFSLSVGKNDSTSKNRVSNQKVTQKPKENRLYYLWKLYSLINWGEFNLN